MKKILFIFAVLPLFGRAQIIDTTMLNEVEVHSQRIEEDGTRVSGKDIEFTTGAEGGVEGVVKTFAGVSSRNEMSSQYNVRGGNFDENLVYINGFEVFRPFLARAGQQEGMSIIHPQLVSNITFSAGGFSALYGDKLSSVLDVRYEYPRNADYSKMTFETSLTGVNWSMIENSKQWTIATGLRYRNNVLLLRATDVQSDYYPVNADGQMLLTKNFGNTPGDYGHAKLEFFAHFAHNRMNQIPQNRQTNFGSLQEALQLNVFFDGQEKFGYDTQFLAAKYQQSTYIKGGGLRTLSASGFHTTELEITDVIGYYRLNELNNDLGSDDFGEISLVRGVGAFQDFRRNFLDAYIGNVKYEELISFNRFDLTLGGQFQGENIYDRYKEWERIDSAGYSLPYTGSTIDSVIDGRLYATPAEGIALFSHVAATQTLMNTRAKAWANLRGQLPPRLGRWNYNVGARLQWAGQSGEIRISPRVRFHFIPDGEKFAAYRWTLSAGLYDQYPFYREMRLKNGSLNTHVLSQQALHLIARQSKTFALWERPFVWNLEAYYKGMQRVNLFDVENVRIRYQGNNDGLARVYGIDSRINGEFVKGTDSWFTFSLFRAQERTIDSDQWFARPTDTRFNFAVYFQDYLPNDPTTRMSLTLMLGGGFPFGPSGIGDEIATPEQRVFLSPPYRRADIGFIKVLDFKRLEQFEEVWISAEIFNLLQARNTVSYLWIKDISAAGQYAVPNYMTTRLLNLKLHLDF